MKTSSRVTVLVVFHYDGLSTRAVIAFVVIGSIVKYVTSEDKLGFGTCFARGAFYLHCQAVKMNETLCSIIYYTVVSHEVQTCSWPWQLLHTDEMFFYKRIVSIFKFIVAVSDDF